MKEAIWSDEAGGKRVSLSPLTYENMVQKLVDLLALFSFPEKCDTNEKVMKSFGSRILLLLCQHRDESIQKPLRLVMEMIGDLTLVIQTEDGTVYKEITVIGDWLMKRSLYFRGMLQHNMKESRSKRITILSDNNVRPWALEQMIHYFLSDSIEISEDNVVEILVMSNRFQVLSLYDRAFAYLNHFMESTSLSLAELHHLYNVACILASPPLKRLILGRIWPHLESALVKHHDPQLAQHLREEYPELLPFVAKILPHALNQLFPKMGAVTLQPSSSPSDDMSAEKVDHIGTLLLWFRCFFLHDMEVHEALHRKHLYERAVWANQTKLLQMLLDSGLDPRECGSSRYPPLMGAIKHNNLEMVSMLLTAGVDATQTYSVAWGPLLQRQLGNGYNPNFFVHLTAPPYLSIEDLNITMDSEMCPLTLAVCVFFFFFVSFSSFVMTSSPLQVAMAGADKFFDYRIIRRLVESNANVNLAVGTVDGMKQKNTVLMIAAARGPTPLVELLLELGADCNQANRLGWTALHHAACAGNVDIVDVLLAAGANWALKATMYEIDKNREVNLNKAYPKLFMTAREVAAYHKRYNVLKLMRKKGVEE
jgi:hypothetical protein